jgi:hypothetical protein
MADMLFGPARSTITEFIRNVRKEEAQLHFFDDSMSVPRLRSLNSADEWYRRHVRYAIRIGNELRLIRENRLLNGGSESEFMIFNVAGDDTGALSERG